MAPDIALDRQRPAQDVFSQHVAIKLTEIGRAKSAKHPSPTLPRAEAADARGR
jgi:hypothetical protein